MSNLAIHWERTMYQIHAFRLAIGIPFLWLKDKGSSRPQYIMYAAKEHLQSFVSTIEMNPF